MVFRPKDIISLARNYPIHLRALSKKLFPSRDFYKIIFDGKSVFNRILNEIREDNINEYLEKELETFNRIRGRTVRGCSYSSGIVSRRQAYILYASVRIKKPNTVVESGTGNGYSTAFILKALRMNNKGKLYSIDFPEIEGRHYAQDDFYKEKGGAVIPKGQSSGWLVPEYLHDRLKIVLGKSQDVLPKLLEELNSVDIFFHDSEHSYSGMIFEFEQTWPRLISGGILFAHDVNWNKAFVHFAKEVNRKPYFIDGSLGFLIK
ncbi:MAG: class I SAM-dependent methyltransferase [bacterium]